METDVAECRGTWTSWRVVATDHSCLCVMNHDDCKLSATREPPCPTSHYLNDYLTSLYLISLFVLASVVPAYCLRLIYDLYSHGTYH